MNELAIKMAIETTTSCQLVQNFLVCAVETSRLHKLKSFGLVGRHSKLYCLCSRDIQNFVCAVATFKTLFVQWRHSKLYCLCNRVVDRRNYSRDFQFPLRINVKISEHAQNFNVFKPRLVCRRILILPSGSSGNSQKSEILKNLKFSKIKNSPKI